MKNKFLVVIDMQNDFCYTGPLANKDAVAVIPFIKAQIENARKNGIRIVYTRDTHGSDYMETGEGKHLPFPHCIRETKGWEIVDELSPQNAIVFANIGFVYKEIAEGSNDIVINKTHFGFDEWNKIIPEGSEVTICGTVASICVAANASALKSIEGVEVNVLRDGVADLSPEMKEAALKVMEAQHCNIL